MVATLLVALPFLGAFLIPLVGLVSKIASYYLPAAVMAANLGLSLSLLPRVLQTPIVISISGWKPPIAINFVVGPLGLGLAILISLVGLLVTLYGVGYVREEPKEKYHMLVLTLLTGATGMVLTGDIFNLFVFFEILSMSAFSLTGYRKDPLGSEAALKYLIQGALGSTFLLIGIAILYGATGTLNMADIAARLNTADPYLAFVALTLMAIGFGVEAALFPLNAWLPDAYSAAPASVSAMLAGIATKIGLYALFRVAYTVSPLPGFLGVLAALGAITLVVGELAASRQRDDIQRLLAYSSMGQVGLIALAFGMASEDGAFAALFQFLSHTLAKGLLFLAFGYLIYRAGSKRLAALSGIGRKMPFTGAVIAIGVLSLMGVPPFAGFMSKLAVIKAGLASHSAAYTGLVVVVLLATVVEVGYFLRLLQILYFGKPEGEKMPELPLSALIPIAVLAGLIIVIGVYPHLVTGLLHKAAADLVDRAQYIKLVLGEL